MRAIRLKPGLSRRCRLHFKAAVERLERRELLSATNIQPPAPILADTSDPSTNTIDLTQYMNDPNIPGTVAEFTLFSYTDIFGSTREATVDVALTDNSTPDTVQNFLNYVNNRAYNGTFFHRSYNFEDQAGGSPSDPADIVQGGGYFLDYSSPNHPTPEHINTGAPVDDEYSSETLSDTTGTLAMAKTSYADSATSEFYFNLSDNTELDVPTTDPNGVTTSYTVFGQVIGDGMSVIDQIGALPTVEIDSSLTTVPVSGVPSGSSAAGPDNLIYIANITTAPGMTYTVTNDNPTVAFGTVNNDSLTFAYGTPGTANIRVTGTSFDGSTTAEVFSVTVPDPSQPGEGLTVGTYSPPSIVENSTNTTLMPVDADVDSLSPIDPSTVALVQDPTNGSVLVEPTVGYILYTPNAGYTGPDSLQFTVSDTSGVVSPPITVDLQVVPSPLQVTIGTKASRSLIYTQPDGTVGDLTVAGGTAVVTFDSYDVQTSIGAHEIVTASGPGATISSIEVTNAGRGRASMRLTQTGGTGTLTVDSIHDDGVMTSIVAPAVELTGLLQTSGLQLLSLGSADNASVDIGPVIHSVTVLIPQVTNTSLDSAAPLTLVRSAQWTTPGIGDYTITAPSLATLSITGDFDDGIELSGTANDLTAVRIGGQISGNWNIDGVVGSITAGSAASAWNLFTKNLVRSITLGGNVTSDIAAGAIGTLKIAGNLTGALIQTEATYKKGFVQLVRLSVGGDIIGSTIYAAGNVGTISAAAMLPDTSSSTPIPSQIAAGVDNGPLQSTTLSATSDDFIYPAKIAAVLLGSASPAFSDSRILAYQLGTLKLGVVQTSNGGNAHGVIAELIGSLQATLDTDGPLILRAAQLKNDTVLTAALANRQLADFQVDLVTAGS